MYKFSVGENVTDGECHGIVTAVFDSDDDLGNITPCLSVRLPGGQESFTCTRADWWRPE